MNPLRPAPSHSPRPQITDDVVLARAVQTRRAEVEAWASTVPQATGFLHGVQFVVDFALVSALKVGKLDAYRVARELDTCFGWAVDAPLVKLCQLIIDTLPPAWKLVTAEWVAATGYRVPAAEGDTIMFAVNTATGEENWEGVVMGVVQAEGVAYVRQVGGCNEGWMHRLPGEQITLNKRLIAEENETPTVGRTFAPAAIAEHLGAPDPEWVNRVVDLAEARKARSESRGIITTGEAIPAMLHTGGCVLPLSIGGRSFDPAKFKLGAPLAKPVPNDDGPEAA